MITPSAAPRRLCIWLPNWPIQRRRGEEKIPPSTPLVLWSIDPRRGRIVVAACPAAQACGVRPQLPLVEARGLLQRAAAAAAAAPRVLPHDPAADLQALQQLAESFSLSISPLVALEPLEKARWAGQTLHQPQALFLDVTGSGQWFGSESKLLEQAAAVLKQHDLSGRMALSSSVGSAWAMAHYAIPPQAIPPQAMPYHLPSEHGDCTIWVVPPEDTERAIGPLPVAALRLSPEAAQKLHRLGIERIDQLLRLPRSGLATRLGPEVLRRIDQALATVDQSLPMHHAAAEDVVSTELEYPTFASDLLKHRIGQLIQQLAGSLAGRQQGALRLTCRLDLQDQSPQQMQLGLFAPTADAAHLTSLMESVFEQQRLSARVHRIVLAAPLTAPLRSHAQNLWTLDEPAAAGDGMHLARLIDGLSSRLGRQRILGVRCSDNPLPEQAYRATPLAGRRARSSSSSSSKPPCPASPQGPLRRPLDLLLRPEKIEVLQFHAEGWPLCIQLRRWPRPQLVRRAWGPERIETGWWQGPSIRRDYFRIETEQGQWLWVFRQLGQSTWMLHGWFG